MIPKPGDRIPDFTLPAGSREGRGSFTLSKALGEGPVVFAFYPLAFTGTCTKEVCEARDGIGAFASLGAKVFGFSTDTMPANVEFAKMHDLPFPLVSDANREVVHRIWETQTVLGVRDVAKRGVLVLDRDGVVVHARAYDDPGAWEGLGEAREAVARAAARA